MDARLRVQSCLNPTGKLTRLPEIPHSINNQRFHPMTRHLLQLSYKLRDKRADSYFLLYTFNPFLVFKSHSPLLHCFQPPLPLLGSAPCSAAHRTSTRSQEHTKYVPTCFQHVVTFSKSCTGQPRRARQASTSAGVRTFSIPVKPLFL